MRIEMGCKGECSRLLKTNKWQERQWVSLRVHATTEPYLDTLKVVVCWHGRSQSTTLDEHLIWLALIRQPFLFFRPGCISEPLLQGRYKVAAHVVGD
jgi:hypothetical protein